MRRRTFVAALGAEVFTLPRFVQAQSAALPVVGFLSSASPVTLARPLQAFHRALEEAGYVEGKNIAIEYRWAEGRFDRLPAMAADLVRRQVTAIVATTGSAALAAKAATTSTPIVFETGADPVRLGIVASLSRPGGNVTGVSQLTTSLAPKDLELLHELLPTARVMALLINSANAIFAETEASDVRAAADTFGLELLVLNASSDGDFDGAFAELRRSGAAGLVIGGNAFFSTRLDALAALALSHGIPAVYTRREFAAAGGLLGYGNDLADTYRQVGIYAGRILKGEKPADLPVQQATKVELVINLKTAAALGLTVPTTLLARADEVIE
jgi:ABC-type uncharacterized transport system substrate-binding protein